MRKRQKYWFPKPYKKSWMDVLSDDYGGSILEWIYDRHPNLVIVLGGFFLGALIFFAMLG